MQVFIASDAMMKQGVLNKSEKGLVRTCKEAREQGALSAGGVGLAGTCRWHFSTVFLQGRVWRRQCEGWI